jgi:hypothetical protein
MELYWHNAYIYWLLWNVQCIFLLHCHNTSFRNACMCCLTTLPTVVRTVFLLLNIECPVTTAVSWFKMVYTEKRCEDGGVASSSRFSKTGAELTNLRPQQTTEPEDQLLSAEMTYCVSNYNTSVIFSFLTVRGSSLLLVSKCPGLCIPINFQSQFLAYAFSLIRQQCAVAILAPQVSLLLGLTLAAASYP